MSRNKVLVNRIISTLLIVGGLLFGGSWKSSKLCLGDWLFSSLGIPTWSDGTTGIHYPAMVGIVFILIGIGLLNSTLDKWTRIWVWVAGIFIYFVLTAAMALL